MILDFPNRIKLIYGDNVAVAISQIAESMPPVIENLYLDTETTSSYDSVSSLNPWKVDFCKVLLTALTWDEHPYVYCVVNNGVALPLWALKRAKNWVNHNVKYDSHVWYNNFNVDFKGDYVDTLTFSKIIDSDRTYKGGYGLDVLSKVYCKNDLTQFYEQIKTFREDSEDFGHIVKRKRETGEIPPEGIEGLKALAVYAGQQVQANRMLYKEFEKLLPEDCKGVWATERRLTKTLIAMERRGMMIDPLKVKVEDYKASKRMEQIKELLDAVLPKEYADFNPKSHKQCEDLLIAHFGLPEIYKGDKEENAGPSFDRSVLKLYKQIEYSPIEVLELIDEYRHLDTMCGLFWEPWQFMHVEGVLHSDNNQCVRSGRMSCKEPNNQQFDDTARSMIFPRPGYSFLVHDYCLAGDTPVITDEGEKPLKDILVGERVLSCFNANELAFKKVERTKYVGDLPTYRITLDSGDSVECTGEHRWIDYHGNEIKTKDLQIGQSLAHVKTGYNGTKKYPTWWVKSQNNYVTKHRLVAGEGLTSADHVHHIDGNVENWHRSNLEVKLWYEHISEHSKNNWDKLSKEKKREKVSQLVSGQATRRSYLGEGNPNYKGIGWLEPCEQCGNPVRQYPYPQSRRRLCKQCKTNHKVVFIEYVGIKPVYCIQVEDWHTYVLANGLVSHNSQIEYRFIVHYIENQTIIGAYRENPKLDFHQLMADSVGIERDAAKTLNLAMGYGMGKNKTLESLRNNKSVIKTMGGNKERINELATRAYGEFHRRLPELKPTTREAELAARRRGYVRNAYGRRCHLPLEYSYTAFNRVCQSHAADLIKERANALDDIREQYGAHILALVHDEVLQEVPNENLEEYTRVSTEVLTQSSVPLLVPICASCGTSDQNWKEAKH